MSSSDKSSSDDDHGDSKDGDKEKMTRMMNMTMLVRDVDDGDDDGQDVDNGLALKEKDGK